MVASKKLVTNSFKLHTAKQILESLNETANTVYYVFAGKHTEKESSSIPRPYESVSNTYLDVYRNMIFGKRVGVNDVSLMIERNDYVANTVYDMYDDMEKFSNNSYTIVNSGTYYHVFKCLFNNNGSPSVYSPNFADTDAQDDLYETSDSYIWKYMYSVDNTKVSKFATEDYFPLVPNVAVQSTAVPGAISVIKVEEPGQGYNNYAHGSFKSDELRVGSDIYYSVASSNNASSVSGFYNGCYIKITNGAAEGRFAKIVQYTVNSTAKIIKLDAPFTTKPALNSSWEITPGVVIYGDTGQTANAEARAIVNAVSNTIERIEMLTVGSGYKYARCFVYAASVVGVTPENTASIRAILAPYGGHGSNPEEELGATRICFSTTFANSVNDPFLSSKNDYQQIGIIKDPLFDNVTLQLKNTQGTFASEEDVYRISPVRVFTDSVVSVAGCTAITATDAEFKRQFTSGDFVYMTNDTQSQITTVDTIPSNTSLTLSEAAYISSSDLKLYEPNITSTARVRSVAVGSVDLTSVAGVFQTDDMIVGSRSGAVAYVNSVIRNTVSKGFETFNQMYKYEVDVKSLNFEEDEIVYQQELDVANAVLQSMTNGNTVMYVTNQLGNFNVANDIIGVTSGAVASVINKYSPELIFGSGSVLFLENIQPVTRQGDQTETFKIILDF